MKPRLHAKVSVKKFGGKPEDYFEIHQFIDSSKATHADMRHRALLHSSFGCYVTESVFGIYITNSDGKEVSVRDIAEQHVIDDMGRIPSVSEYLDGMPFYDWLGGRPKQKVTVPFDLGLPHAPKPIESIPVSPETEKKIRELLNPRPPIGLDTKIID